MIMVNVKYPFSEIIKIRLKLCKTRTRKPIIFSNNAEKLGRNWNQQTLFSESSK